MLTTYLLLGQEIIKQWRKRKSHISIFGLKVQWCAYLFRLFWLFFYFNTCLMSVCLFVCLCFFVSFCLSVFVISVLIVSCKFLGVLSVCWFVRLISVDMSVFAYLSLCLFVFWWRWITYCLKYLVFVCVIEPEKCNAQCQWAQWNTMQWDKNSLPLNRQSFLPAKSEILRLFVP